MDDVIQRLQAYRSELREVIRSRPRIVMDATNWFREDGAHSSSRGPAFRLGSSDRCQREFVCLWELFDESDVFPICLDRASDLVNHIRDNNSPFTTIVTATVTAKHIVDQLHAKIETNSEKVRVVFLNHFPYLTSDARSLLRFQREDVLIATDVIASGSLVRHLAETTEQLGGNVVGVLAVVASGEEFVHSNDDAQLDLPTISFRSSNGASKTVLVHSLTDYLTKRVTDFDPEKLIEIDPNTVYPREQPISFLDQADHIDGMPSRFDPCFSQDEMYDHLDETHSLRFDILMQDESCFTTGVHIPTLIEGKGDEIWCRLSHRIADWCDDCTQVEHSEETFEASATSARHDVCEPRWVVLPKGSVVVTTFNLGDREFKEFVQKRLGNDEYGVVFMQRQRDSHNGDGALFLSQKKEGFSNASKELDGAHVVLLLSSVTSAQTLRDLVSYIASAGAHRVHAVCLLNRMGALTKNFVYRLERLLSGGNSTEHTVFEFTAVYNIIDVDADNVRRLRSAVASLFDYYCEHTRVPSFRRWVDQTRKYFEPHPTTDLEFATRSLDEVPIEMTVSLKSPTNANKEVNVSVKTIDAALSIACAKFAIDRERRPLLKLLESLTKKADLYKLFGVLLLNLGQLRLLNEAAQIRDSILRRLTGLRVKRMKLEEQSLNPGAEIGEIVDIETHLVLGLSLFSYADRHSESDYGIAATQALTCSLSALEWLKYPENFASYFGDERVVWTISMLLHLSHPGFEAAETRKELKNLLKREVNGLLEVQNHLEENALADERSRLRRAKDNLNQLMTDLGAYDMRQPHEVVRFLHSQLLKPKRRHSPIESTLSRCTTVLTSAVDFAMQQPHLAKLNGNAYRRRVRVDEPDVQEAVEAAVFTSGLLEQVAEAAREMFRFSTCKPGEAVRYLADARDTRGLQWDVIQIGDLLQMIRTRNEASKKDLEDLAALMNRIESDIWDDDEPLRKTLLRYIVPASSTLFTAMKEAKNSFTARSRFCQDAFDNCLPELATSAKAIVESRQDLVLVDPFLLSETFRNICTNVRHTLRSSEPIAEYSSRVSWRIKLPKETGEERVVCEVRAAGAPFDESAFLARLPGSTFEQHQRDLERYGAVLSLFGEDGDESQTVARVSLISRPSEASASESEG